MLSDCRNLTDDQLRPVASSLLQWVSIFSPAASSWDACLSAFVLLLLLPCSVIMGDVYSFTKDLPVILNFVMPLSITECINPILYGDPTSSVLLCYLPSWFEPLGRDSMIGRSLLDPTLVHGYQDNITHQKPITVLLRSPKGTRASS